MTSIADDAVLSRIMKPLALAEGGASEQESFRTMEQVHRLLAQHNLSISQIKAHERSTAAAGRKVDQTQFDPAVDRWTVALWHASADLFFCGYFLQDEGAPDARGKWRCSRIRHCLIGSEANKVTAKVMADHFCRVIRRLAVKYAQQWGGGLAARRSFQQGCADRLIERIREQKKATSGAETAGTTLPALLSLYNSERLANEAALTAQGIKLRAGRRHLPRKTTDVLAEHHGRTAAENISLALQIAIEPSRAASKPLRTATSQIDFAF